MPNPDTEFSIERDLPELERKLREQAEDLTWFIEHCEDYEGDVFPKMNQKEIAKIKERQT